MEFVGYETRDKLIWTSSECYRNTNTIRKQGIPKRSMNMTSTSATLGFGCYTHKDTCELVDISILAKKKF